MFSGGLAQCDIVWLMRVAWRVSFKSGGISIHRCFWDVFDWTSEDSYNGLFFVPFIDMECKDAPSSDVCRACGGEVNLDCESASGAGRQGVRPLLPCASPIARLGEPRIRCEMRCFVWNLSRVDALQTFRLRHESITIGLVLLKLDCLAETTRCYPPWKADILPRSVLAYWRVDDCVR